MKLIPILLILFALQSCYPCRCEKIETVKVKRERIKVGELQLGEPKE